MYGTAHRMWIPNVGGTHHTVVARWNPWTFQGELVVDGAFIKSWGGPRLARPDIKFQIEGHDAFLRNTLMAFDLFVDSGKVPYKLTVPYFGLLKAQNGILGENAVSTIDLPPKNGASFNVRLET